jgi:uncharacterized protein (DUF1330 family)
MSERHTLIASIWLKNGDVERFEAFERAAARVMAKHGGRIERAIRVGRSNVADAPFEVHVTSFPDAAAYAAYQDDPETRELGALRAAIVARMVIHAGSEMPPYA